MTWQSVGTHTFVPTDQAVQVGSFDLAAGQDTIWVRITQLNDPGNWPWSYGILSWRNANGTPLGSIKAYSNRLGEVFRLGNGLAPLDGVGSIWFEPRGFNLGWLKAGFPWELSFEAQAGATEVSGSYWNRDPNSGLITPKTSGDNLDMSPGWIKAKNLILTDGTGASNERDVAAFLEGTWSPALSGGGVVTGTVWSRIGQQVWLSCRITDFPTGSSAQLAVTGLPFGLAVTGHVGHCMTQYITNPPGTVYARVSNQDLSFYQSTVNTLVKTDYSKLNNASASIYFSASYLTDDTSWVPANNAVITTFLPRDEPVMI